MPDLDSSISSDGTAQYGKYEQGKLRCSPLAMLGFPLINAISEECNGIDDDQYDDNFLFHLPFILLYCMNSNCKITKIPDETASFSLNSLLSLVFFINLHWVWFCLCSPKNECMIWKKKSHHEQGVLLWWLFFLVIPRFGQRAPLP